MPYWLTQLLYLASAVLFIIGLKRLGSPATARQGNLVSLRRDADRDAGHARSIRPSCRTG